MSQPLRSRYLTHTYPMYRGCDLIELLWLGVTILVGLFLACVLFGLLTGWWQWWVKFIELFVAVPVGIVIFRVATAKIADFKKDKPPAYLINRLSQRLGLNESGRVQRCGDWDTSRTIEWKEDE